MTYRLVVSREAQNDLIQAARWYEKRQTGLGVRFLHAVEDELDKIKVRPRSFPAANNDGNIRRALTHRFPYGVFFRMDEETIVILAVIHGAREPRDWNAV